MLSPYFYRYVEKLAFCKKCRETTTELSNTCVFCTKRPIPRIGGRPERLTPINFDDVVNLHDLLSKNEITNDFIVNL